MIILIFFSSHITNFVYRIPASVDLQSFIQRCCDMDSVKSQVRYKIKFKCFPGDGRLLEAGCHMEEQEYGTFKHIWTRVNVLSDATKHAIQDKKKIDIVCPGRYLK